METKNPQFLSNSIRNPIAFEDLNEKKKLYFTVV